MHAIAGADDRDALARRPPSEMFEVEVPAGGAGIFGMHVEVGVKVMRYICFGCKASEFKPYGPSSHSRTDPEFRLVFLPPRSMNSKAVA